MISGLVMALGLLAAQAAPGAVATPAPTPAAAAPPSDPEDAPLDLDQLHQMYRDTCEGREFGAYDDMCDQLRQQVRQAERAAAQAARRHPKPAAAAPAPPP